MPEPQTEPEWRDPSADESKMLDTVLASMLLGGVHREDIESHVASSLDMWQEELDSHEEG